MDNDAFGLVYVRTKEGVFKVVEVIFGLVAFICILVNTTSWASTYIGFFNSATLLGFIYALIVLLVSLTPCYRPNSFSFRKIDCIVCLILSNLIFISSTLITTISTSDTPELTAAGAFGYMNGIVYMCNSAIKILSY